MPNGHSWQTTLLTTEKITYAQGYLMGYSRGYIQAKLDGKIKIDNKLDLQDWKGNAEDHVRRINDFYATYPESLSEDLELTVYRLIMVWQDRATYQSAAAKCK